MGRPAARTERRLTLDAGALIALDRGERRVQVLLKRAREVGTSISIPAGVVAQAWRNGRRQVGLARFLSVAGIEIVTLDDRAARAAGQLCGVAGTSDVIDASVVLCARDRGAAVMTSDPDDLRRLDATIELLVV